MTVCLEGSRVARTVRTETVFPAPTSPVMTPIARSLMHQEMRATASLWEACRCSIPGARLRRKGIRRNPWGACSFSIKTVSWLVIRGGGGVVVALDAGEQVAFGAVEGSEFARVGPMCAGI